jgi:hypothetical protein
VVEEVVMEMVEVEAEVVVAAGVADNQKAKTAVERVLQALGVGKN